MLKVCLSNVCFNDDTHLVSQTLLTPVLIEHNTLDMEKMRAATVTLNIPHYAHHKTVIIHYDIIKE